MVLFCLILVVCLHLGGAQIENVTVTTVYGDVIGQGIPVSTGNIINSFLGVPYARPPIGNLRFTRPEEPDAWDEPLYAKEPGNACIQSLFSSVQVTHRGWTRYSEDCLHLNIYTPQGRDPDVLLPVMVWYHGGAFQGGSNFMYPGYFLADKNVTVVTVNYRLGIMGFAYSGDDVIPGNMGLSDQILALRFVQENIAAFGGNPNNVTIFGESAGANSVGYHLMSPFSTGLFHGAILHSGSEMALWGLYEPDQMPENYLSQVAEKFNCSNSETIEMVDCLRQVDSSTLDSATFECTPGYECSGFLPVLDGELIPDFPINIRESEEYNKVPEMIGCTENEGTVFSLGYRDGLNRSDFDVVLWEKVSLFSPSWPDPSRDEDVFKALQFYYADWPYYDDPIRNRDIYAELQTDQSFGFTSDWQAKLHSADDLPVYYYTYDYVPEVSAFPEWTGSFHGIDLLNTFGWPFMVLEENEPAFNHSQAEGWGTVTFTERDRQISDFILTLWTNFAKFQNPTPTPVNGPDGPITWHTYTETEFNYLQLSNRTEMAVNYRQQNYAFWREYLPYLVHGNQFSEKKYPIAASLYLEDYILDIED